MKFQAIIDGTTLDISIQNQSSALQIICDNEYIEMDCQALSSNSYSLILNGKSHFLSIISHPQGYEVTIDQHTNIVTIKDEQQLLLEKFGFSSTKKIQAGKIIAQIPGLISQIFVSVGDTINEGPAYEYGKVYMNAEKAYSQFQKAIDELGRFNTKHTGEKTDQKIFEKQWKKQVVPFYKLMKSWIRGKL